MQEAIFYRNHYYKLPEGFDTAKAFAEAVKNGSVSRETEIVELIEDRGNRGYVEKGISIAPYFIGGYEDKIQTVNFENADEIYPVSVEILTQEEYNRRLRAAVNEYCPGCRNFSPLTNRESSLNGHFEEITLNKVCFFRVEKTPYPRVFRDLLLSAGGLWKHFPPHEKTADVVIDNIKSWMYIKYDNAEFSPEDKNILLVAHKKDFFLSVLTSVLSDYIESCLYYTPLRLKDTETLSFTESDVLDVLSKKKRGKLQKECKKYGVSLAVLEYSKEADAEIESSLEECVKHNFLYPVCKSEGKTYFVLTDTCQCLKALHFRFPMLERYNTKITVYSQYDVKRYTVSVDMPCDAIEE